MERSKGKTKKAEPAQACPACSRLVGQCDKIKSALDYRIVPLKFVLKELKTFRYHERDIENHRSEKSGIFITYDELDLVTGTIKAVLDSIGQTSENLGFMGFLKNNL